MGQIVSESMRPVWPKYWTESPWYTDPRWMCDRESAWLKDAVLKMGPILLGAPFLPSQLLHEGPWSGLEPDRI
jgi:hypothetical protein